MTNIITSCPQVSHSPQISSKCRHKCHHSQISITSTSPSTSIVDGHSTGPTAMEVCPELEVCHEHHSTPPIAHAQKRSGCELKLVSTLQEISYLREEIDSLKKKVINLIIMHLCGPLASSCTFLLSNKSVQKEIFCVLLVFIIFLSCIFLPEGCAP